jgi:hypothetical protein
MKLDDLREAVSPLEGLRSELRQTEERLQREYDALVPHIVRFMYKNATKFESKNTSIEDLNDENLFVDEEGENTFIQNYNAMDDGPTKEKYEEDFEEFVEREERRQLIREQIKEPLNLYVALVPVEAKKVDLYAPVIFEEQNNGLMRGFMRSVGQAVLMYDKDAEMTKEKGIVKITLSVDYDTLVQEIEQRVVPGFDRVNIKVNVVGIPDLVKKYAGIPWRADFDEPK